MNNKHTPGPWKFENKGYRIEVRTDELHTFAFGVSDEGNARLIAAAPELLEACQTFAEWLRREESGFVKAGNERYTPEGEAAWSEWYSENLRICDLAQKQAYSAIAKATGKN